MNRWITLTSSLIPLFQAAPSAPAPRAAKCTSFELPALRLGELQNAQLPKSIGNDRGFLLGGVGSDLWHAPSDTPDEFWLVTDRGPNGQVKVGDATRRTFPVPEFTPHVLHVRAKDGALTIIDKLALVGASGKPVTGLPNVAKRDETPYDATGQAELAFHASGLDTEGLVRTKSGDFWLSDEYGPSLVHVAASGKVLERYVPAGLQLAGADYEVTPALPSIYGKRKNNRGFEGLTLSRDEKTLFVLLQSPLLVPDKKTGESSRQSRILAFDVASEKPIAEYVYRTEVAADIDPKSAGKQDDVKLSGLVALDAHRLLVLERTDDLAKLFIADLEGATNVLGTKWDDVETTPSLEALDDPAKASVQPLAKHLAVDLAAIKDVPHKIEGIAVLDDHTIAVANDNDFDVGKLDDQGNNVGEGAKCRVIVITLSQPLD